MGLSEVVGVCLLVSESGQNLKWMLETFKAQNDIKDLRVVMADKDFTMRGVIKKCFDKAEVSICLFHALK